MTGGRKGRPSVHGKRARTNYRKPETPSSKSPQRSTNPTRSQFCSRRSTIKYSKPPTVHKKKNLTNKTKRATNHINSSKPAFYVSAKIHGKDVISFIDCGSEITIISSKIYTRMPIRKRPPLRPVAMTALQADGITPLRVRGEAEFTIHIGPNTTTLTAIVAEISEDVLLGNDYILAAPAEIRTHSFTLGFHEGTVPILNQYGGYLSARVKTIYDTTIPAGHEMVIAGLLNRRISGSSCGIVEPAKNDPFRKDGVMVGRVLIDTTQRTIPIRLMNVSDKEFHLRKGVTIALATTVHDPDRAPESTSVTGLVNQTKVSEHTDTVPQHLQSVLDESVSTVGEEHRQKIANFLCTWQDIFSRDNYDVGHTNVTRHSINTGDNPPIKQQPRRQSAWTRNETKKLINEMLEKKVVEPSNSPWAAPVVLVTKKDGSTRFCVDYRKLNDITKKDAYAIPRIEDSINSLAGAKLFSTLDLTSGYWQVELDDEAKDKCSFTSWHGLYTFRVMPFGLCNAPATFQRLMENVLAGLQFEILLLYLDDIIVFSNSVDQMIKRLTIVFQRLRTAGLKLKPSKCHLFQREVEYLGYKVSEQGVQTSDDKVKAIREWPTPTNVTEVRSFLGLASYYRRFVQNFSEVARPLTKLTEKGRTFEWDSENDVAFDTLKRNLIDAPILAYPSLGDPFIVDVDASFFGIGGVLSQVQNGVERVISYSSRTLSKAERNYCVTRKELLAVVHFVKHFRPYLYGGHFTLRTDHSSLRWLLNFKEPEGQLARWMEVLGEYDFTIIHRPGKKHGNADGLSRRPCNQCGRSHGQPYADDLRNAGSTNCMYTSTPRPRQLKFMRPTNGSASITRSRSTSKHRADNHVTGKHEKPRTPRRESKQKLRTATIEFQPEWDSSTLRRLQLEDSDIEVILKAREKSDEPPSWEEISPCSVATKAYWSKWSQLEVKDGVLHYVWTPPNDTGRVRKLIILPSSLRTDVIDELHNSKSSAHMGVFKTHQKLRIRYYWHGQISDVRSMIRQCDVCAARKTTGKRKRAPLRQYIVGSPMERVAFDIIGPFPLTERENKYVLVVGDYFTKWVECYPIPNQEAITVATKLVDEVITRFGVFRQCHSDQGRNFESAVISEMCKLLGIKKTRTTPYNPKSDGFVERFNRTLIQLVSVLVDPSQSDWDLMIPYAMMAYRSSVQESTGESPSMMMFGREMELPVDLFCEATSEDTELQTDYAWDLRNRLRDAHERARRQLQRSAVTQKRYYDIGIHGSEFTPGQFVWLRVEAYKRGMSKKLTSRHWDGPYLITEKLNEVVYRIQRSQFAKPKVVHYDRLKLYEGVNAKDWRTPRSFSHSEETTDSPERMNTSDYEKDGEGRPDPCDLNPTLRENETEQTPADDEIDSENHFGTGTEPDEIGNVNLNEDGDTLGNGDDIMPRDTTTQRKPNRQRKPPNRFGSWQF